MRKLFKNHLCLFALTACMCASLNEGGSGTNTGNGIIVGKIVDHSGESVEGVGITVRPNDYLQAPPWKTTQGEMPGIRETATGSDGLFTVDSLPTGAYAIEANDKRGNAVLMKCSVTQDGPATTLAGAALEPYATIIGTVAVAPSSVRQYVQIYGLERCIAVDSNGNYTFGNLPAGIYTLHIISSDTTVAPITIPEQPAISGAITQAPPVGWRYSKKIHLNTTTSGAGIAGNVTDFPVLIRLNSNTFDFNQAFTGGVDVRFEKSNGSPLPYEIEQWNAAIGQAAIWVKVDTIHGDDSTQSLIMYWGNSNAADGSNSAGVFDSSSGFEGVWHLNETSGSLARDASHNGFTGTYKGGLPKNVTGPTGISQNITMPDSDYIDIGNILNPGMKNISLGVWVKRATYGSPQALIAKTNGNTPSDTFGYLLSFDPYNYPHFHIASGGASWGDKASFNISSNMVIADSTTWHYIVVVIDRADNNNCKIYIDGIDRTGSPQGTITSVSAVANALSLHIGTQSNTTCSYKGAIGEASIAFTLRSADWVKLAYMNQQAQDALLKW